MDSQLPVDLLKPVSNLLEVIQHGVGGHLNVIHLSSLKKCYQAKQLGRLENFDNF